MKRFVQTFRFTLGQAVKLWLIMVGANVVVVWLYDGTWPNFFANSFLEFLTISLVLLMARTENDPEGKL